MDLVYSGDPLKSRKAWVKRVPKKKAEDDQTVSFMPDVLIIPSRVILNPEVSPLEAKVYGVIYWMERLKDGRCWASNATIAKVVGSSSGGVANALVNLGRLGFIGVMMNNDTNQRIGLTTLVRMEGPYNPSSNHEGGVNETMNIGNNIKKGKYTSETEDLIEKIYLLWLKYMVVDPEIRLQGTTDERHDALEAAKKHTRLTDKRKSKIAVRLADAGSARIQRAIVALGGSEFHRGDNDRGWTADIDFLFRSYEQIEEWSNKYKKES